MAVSDYAKNSKSIGLIFEPNFFTAHFYEDAAGKNHLISRSHPDKKSAHLEVEAELSPLFALFSNLNWTLVPRAIFRREDSERYLKINTGFDGTDEAGFVEIPRIESTLIYELDRTADELAKNLHPSLAVRPVILALINYASILAESDFPDLFLLHVRDKIAYIVVIQNKKLHLANSIEVKKSIDLDYFTFYVMKKLGISAEIPFFFTSYRSEISRPSKTLSDRLKKQMELPVFAEKEKSIDEIDLLALIAPECA